MLPLPYTLRPDPDGSVILIEAPALVMYGKMPLSTQGLEQMTLALHTAAEAGVCVDGVIELVLAACRWLALHWNILSSDSGGVGHV